MAMGWLDMYVALFLRGFDLANQSINLALGIRIQEIHKCGRWRGPIMVCEGKR